MVTPPGPATNEERSPPRGRLRALGYFAAPFPSRKGFAAYRSPGPVVHLPAWAALSFVGLALLLPHGYLGWAACLWVLAGLYLGRDLAIFCHYLPFLTLVVLAGCALALAKGDDVFKWGGRHGPILAIVLTLAIAALVAVNALRFARQTD
jgi:hypothetical protein